MIVVVSAAVPLLLALGLVCDPALIYVEHERRRTTPETGEGSHG